MEGREGPTGMMSIKNANTNMVGTRAAVVRNLKILKSPEEGGTKKEFDDFLKKIQNHLTISWDFGKDIGYVVKHMKDPKIEEPTDMTSDKEKDKWRVRLWNQEVDQYGARTQLLEDNKSALYALILDAVSKIVKSKLSNKAGYTKANENNDALWLLETLEDIMVNFEEVKPKILAIDDQMERIMRLKQGESTTNEDFLKTTMKELKIYEKHNGCNFLWGKLQDETLEEKIKHAKSKLLLSDDELKHLKIITKRELKEEIVSMAVLKRADKKRYGNLQTSLKNSYLLGTNNYPSTIPGVLKVLNNYQPQWESQTTEQPENRSGNRRRAAIYFLQSSSKEIIFLRATNNYFFLNITCQFCAIKGNLSISLFRCH